MFYVVVTFSTNAPKLKKLELLYLMHFSIDTAPYNALVSLPLTL